MYVQKLRRTCIEFNKTIGIENSVFLLGKLGHQRD